jgi:ABC-type Na+ efflux pump permease subunit
MSWSLTTALKLDRVKLGEMIALAASGDETRMGEYRGRIGDGVQTALQKQFSKYNLVGKTWAALTRSKPRDGADPHAPEPIIEGGLGVLKVGAARYQILVPSYTVMFAFSLILTVGWLFVAERSQGTLRRLRAAPLTRTQILLGKVLPCFALSLLQGVLLLVLGKLVFQMRWGSAAWPFWQQALSLLPVIMTTSLAAVGLSLFVAALSRTPIQVAIVGSLLVIAFALISGCLIPASLMPEAMREVSLITPHAWALKAYTELLPVKETHQPNMEIVWQSCAVLAGFGVGFLGLAWWLMPLE